jgi:dCMP deaminase
MKQKFIEAYMDVAERFAKLSSAKRLQVGAIVVKDDRIISIGYNGMPSGWDNCCEERHGYTFTIPRELLDEDVQEEYPHEDENGYAYKLKTKPEVLHAETNAIAKLAKSSESGLGATMFVTHSPCIECAKLIYQGGISTVYYRNNYRSDDGINFLTKSKVRVIKND